MTQSGSGLGFLALAAALLIAVVVGGRLVQLDDRDESVVAAERQAEIARHEAAAAAAERDAAVAR
ncbi:MAG: hypothetical protein GEV04_25640, partial [Actinophytocola sp.]|nr:hypothetical protein [Actinophytocola sp.]